MTTLHDFYSGKGILLFEDLTPLHVPVMGPPRKASRASEIHIFNSFGDAVQFRAEHLREEVRVKVSAHRIEGLEILQEKYSY